MPDLGFAIEGAEVAKFAASPQIILKLRITNLDPSKTIQSIALRGQIQIEVTRRRYKPEDQEKLRDLFGEPDRWSQTLKNLLWTHVSVNVPAFQNDTVADVPVPCTFDFNVGATKYFHGLTDGEVPSERDVQRNGFLFRRQCTHAGCADFLGQRSSLQPPGIRLARHDGHLLSRDAPGYALRRDVFERLYDYKVRHGIPTWEQAFESMLEAEEAVRS